MEMKVVLSIAGSDSGGGAGIQADLKTFEAHRVFGTTAITSVTAQNTCGVRAIADLPLEVIAAQIDAVFDDFPVAAVKIGMVRNAAMIHCVAERLRERAADIPVVLDPVMIATSGDRLMRDDAVVAIVSDLIPLALLVTPNLDEAEVLSGMSIDNVDDMGKAAREIV
jgi:hydroxymethylpyrimidine/phosphomethylpyrimidine kinase